MKGPFLEGEKLFLRSLSLDDCNEKYEAWLNDVRINHYLETRWSRQEHADICRFVEDINESTHSYLFGIFVREEMKHIGNIKLGPIQPIHQYADVSYFIGDTDCWGQGFATEAISLVSDFALFELGLHRVQAGIYASNVGSGRALLKAGYQQEGIFKAKYYLEDGWEDAIIFGKVNKEWKEK